MGDNSKIKEKIAKLLEKANSTNNLQEAELFLSKVNLLLNKYNITMSDIESTTKDLKEKKTIKVPYLAVYVEPNYVEGMDYLIQNLSKFFYVLTAKSVIPEDFRLFFKEAKLPSYVIVGYDKTNIDTFCNTIKIIYEATVAEFHKGGLFKGEDETIENNFSYFCIGVLRTLMDRLNKESEDSEEYEGIGNKLVILRSTTYNNITESLGENLIEEKSGNDLLSMLTGQVAGKNIPIKDSEKLY